ncbi:MAG: outer membrane protein assembly factor BamA [Bacteroidales bacterium]|nr:outer membrane protein assembly factor BamA [Bacteroidales bacterium]
MYKIIPIVLLTLSLSVFAQNTSDTLQYDFIDYSRVREYVIADIQISGVKYLQPTHLVTISGLSKGMKIKIPGPEISSAVRKYWKHGLFSDVQILISRIDGNEVYLEIRLKEQPRLNKLEISGINNTEKEDIEEKINIRRGTQITEDVLNTTSHIIKEHFREKGFLNTGVDLKMEDDTDNPNMVNLFIRINKSNRIKIEEIEFIGNEAFPDKRLRRAMKKTKQRDWNIFKGSKFIADNYKEDKAKLIEFYNERGYRDAKILEDELTDLNDKRVKLKLTVHEGDPYYIRKIDWVGNTQYTEDQLNLILGIKPGQIYDKKLLNERITMDEDAITSLYMDNGYLFFNINPVEKRIENDSIDLEIRIYEGKQATLNDIIISGNTKTNEHVVRRELYTRPGELFSRTDIIRSVRELATLGHFNPETISPNPIPNSADGTVDIEYSLEERANDQLELSGGWGGYYGFMGTLGVRFSNFSMGNVFKKNAWRPVPSGDGQTLQIRAQASGKRYTGYNISFIEPWFGGKKPNSLSVSLYYSKQRVIYGYDYSSFDENDPFFSTLGASVGLGRRLKWPDDYFSVYNELSLQQYQLNNYPIGVLETGKFNLFSLKTVISRSSQDQMIYPRRGSNLTFSLRLTPPYSLFRDETNYDGMDVNEKFKLVEFHKWTFTGNWYVNLIDKLVLALHAEFGYLGAYNQQLGAPPFEKFEVGGDGLSGYDLTGTDVVALRGYENRSISPKLVDADGNVTSRTDGNIYDRYYLELRYPFSLNPSATIYGLVYLEGGNAWRTWGEFNPLSLKRSAGAGLRAFLPMFGLLGVDWGYGFDPSNEAPNDGPSGNQWHFVLGQQF